MFVKCSGTYQDEGSEARRNDLDLTLEPVYLGMLWQLIMSTVGWRNNTYKHLSLLRMEWWRLMFCVYHLYMDILLCPLYIAKVSKHGKEALYRPMLFDLSEMTIFICSWLYWILDISISSYDSTNFLLFVGYFCSLALYIFDLIYELFSSC